MVDIRPHLSGLASVISSLSEVVTNNSQKERGAMWKEFLSTHFSGRSRRISAHDDWWHADLEDNSRSVSGFVSFILLPVTLVSNLCVEVYFYLQQKKVNKLTQDSLYKLYDIQYFYTHFDQDLPYTDLTQSVFEQFPKVVYTLVSLTKDIQYLKDNAGYPYVIEIIDTARIWLIELTRLQIEILEEWLTTGIHLLTVEQRSLTIEQEIHPDKNITLIQKRIELLLKHFESVRNALVYPDKKT